MMRGYMNFIRRAQFLMVLFLFSSPLVAGSEFWRNLINPLPTHYSSDAHRCMKWFANDEARILFYEIQKLEESKVIIPIISEEFKKSMANEKEVDQIVKKSIDPMINNINTQVKAKQERLIEVLSNNMKDSWLVPVAKNPNLFKYGTYAIFALSVVAYKQGWFGKIWDKCKQVVGIKKESK